MEAKTLHEKLLDIQQRLKVPKSNNNEFGGFTYRNLEDIEDKVKPLLREHGLTLVFGDEPVAVGDRVYIKATAKLSDGKNEITNSAYAREAVSPKSKTDDSQLTGGTSSYARKYAASGLFLIDNTRDADSQDNSESRKPERFISATAEQKKKIKEMLSREGIETAGMPQVLQDKFDVPVGEPMSLETAHNIIEVLEKQSEN